MTKADVQNMVLEAFHSAEISQQRVGTLLRQLNAYGVEATVAELPESLRLRLGLYR